MAEVTATESEQQLTPEVKVEELGPAARRLIITVPPESVSSKIDESMHTLVEQTALPGFRKGRAPRALIERRFGQTLRKETGNQLIAEAYTAAVEQNGLKPVGEPEFEGSMEEIEVEAGKPLTFSVNVEVRPEFELPPLEEIELSKPVLEITDELVQSELHSWQLRLGSVHQIEGDFQKGDRLSGASRVTRKGESEPFFTHDGIAVIHPGTDNGGRGQVLGLMVDDLGQRLDGVKVGDTVTIETRGPELHEREDIRGVDLVIEIDVLVAERIEPAPVEELVRTLNTGTEQILLEQIRQSLVQRRDEEQAEAMRQQVRQHLLETVQFELPEKLSERQISRAIEQQKLQMLYRGMTPEDVETRLAEMRGQSEAQAREQLKLHFIIHHLAEKFDVQVAQNEVHGRVAAIAARRGVRAERLLGELNSAGRLPEIVFQIREAKALDRVVEQAKKTEVSAEQWRVMMAEKEQQQGGARGDKAAAAATTRKKTTTRKTTAKKASASK